MGKNKQTSGLRRASMIGCIAALCSLWSTGWSAKIVYPWRATTAIVKTNETFEVWFSADSGQNLNSVQLKGLYNTVTAVVLSTDTSTWTYDPESGNTCNRKYVVKVPYGTPADRYDLVLKTSTGDMISEKAVKVVREFKDTYYVMHISDSHMYQGTLADKAIVPNRRDVLMKIANILDVEILVETGDIVYGSWLSNQMDEMLNGPGSMLGPNNVSAAVFFTPGDHDAPLNDFPQFTQKENSTHWNTYYGIQHHSFKYGNGRYMMLNNGWIPQSYQTTAAINWLNGAGAGGNFFLTAGHCYDKLHKNINAVKPLDLVLAGDKHGDRTHNPFELDGNPRDSNGDYFADGTAPSVAYIAASVGYFFEYNLFQVNNSAGTFTKPAGSTASTPALSSGSVDSPSTWVPALSLTFTGSNAGTLATNTAKIFNQYGFKIFGAKARFIMKRGTYTASAGTIHQQFDGTLSGVNVTIVDVYVDVAGKSSASITLTPGTVPQVTVPNVVNLTEAAAKSSITGAGLTVSGVSTNYHATVSAGLIYNQNPVAGTKVASGTSVALTVSKGPQPVNQAPYFTVDPFSMADVTSGTAYSQSISGKAIDPEGGSLTFSKTAGPAWLSVSSNGLMTGTPGTVDVGTNSFSVKVLDNGGLSDTAIMTIKVIAATTTVPWVTNLTEAAAGTAITNAGLAVGGVSREYHATIAAGKVFSQTPGGNTSLTRGSTVALAVSLGPQPAILPSVGSIITLKAVNGKYVSATFSTNNTLIADKATVSNYERFKVVNATNGIALQCMGNNLFVSINVPNGSKPMLANRSSIGSYERFNLVESGTSMAIQSVLSTNYVSAISNGAAPLQASQTYAGSYEKFTWKVE